MKVILSIRPEYVQKIFGGTKKFEFRRSIFKNKRVTSVIVYASAPVQRVVGEFGIGKIVCDSPESLWKMAKSVAGISHDQLMAYFDGKRRGYAIEIINPVRYEISKDLRRDFGCRPPQSFVYV